MQLVKRVIQLAKDRALIKFSALAKTMVREAENAMVQELADPLMQVERRTAVAALHALRQEQSAILYGFDTRYRDGVERGLRTMYTDLRQGLDKLSANTLSLIDDETVNRQLEVGHLVQRLRDACDENLGRLNIMIAQMHGDADVHERENPFRPYLIARALYESLNERVADEDCARILFSRLSDSLAAHLSNYYASICEVFDANGIQARLLARPTKLKRHQRDMLAQQLAAMNSTNQPSMFAMGGMGRGGAGSGSSRLEDINSRVLPVLQRMLETLPVAGEQDTDASAGDGLSSKALAGRLQAPLLPELVWKLFNQPESVPTDAGLGQTFAGSAAGVAAAVPGPLADPEVLKQIDGYQRQAADVQEESDAASGSRNELFEIGNRLEVSEPGQRFAIDVVSVLFEFILEDEQIPAGVRARIARLQIPFLKAAMLEPHLLQQASHPARQLLNRIGSATIGLDADSLMAQRLDGEIARLVKRILKEFEHDTALFGDCLQEFESFLAEELANANAEAARSIQAAEEAEKFSAVLRSTAESLHEIVSPMDIDQRVKDFIEQVWARVLVRAARQDAESGAATTGPQYRDVLPELVWSAQVKTTAEERSALMRMLPGLVKRLRVGMLMVHMPEDECKTALDSLVPVHMQVLRQQAPGENAKALPGLEELRKEFSRLVASDYGDAWVLTEPLQVEPEILQSALADKGVEADVDMAPPSPYATTPSKDLLLQLQVGSCVEFRAGDTAAPARLIWVSRHHSLFIFRLDGQTKPMVYAAASLLQALQSGKVGLMEYAPAFDRAVDALMMGAEAVQSSRPGHP
ncbi:uncharacterized protein DUF1631 [Paucimonas lemoignei]|uniref:Uncharacterized protein DUF1631 n=1 Tax=Paucimonas lemoignei TaxID=29443 RepID=A0A4R3I612_PAULE|nr:DUF1631 family protein [Paucimonas lemoignei]TCS39459.1 uncharacterized protein DUF1631 [Paucimonas lemoignei]